MRIAVITPYYKEPLELLTRCADSVRRQTVGKVDQVFVSDGFPNDAIDTFPNATHMRVPNHNDYGDTPRLMGALHAVNRGYDGLAFLDADNWYEPQHLEMLLKEADAKGAPIATATRNLWSDRGQWMGVDTESDGENHVDTNCYLILKPAFSILGSWGFKDRHLSITGDQLFWRQILAAGIEHANCKVPTVNYTTNFAAHWLRQGLEPPGTSKISVRMPDGQTTQIDYETWVRIRAL